MTGLSVLGPPKRQKLPDFQKKSEVECEAEI